jgi:hypothetical protein
MLIIFMSACDTCSSAWRTGRFDSRNAPRASPNITETNRTWRISPCANAPMMLEGITFNRESTTPWAFAAVT